jgi:SAM-dependent methyltransferase
LVNPSSAEKMLKVGQFLRLAPGSQVIDFGSGFGEVLALWAETYGISGTGIEIRQQACSRALHKMVERGLEDRIEIVCANGADFAFPPHVFDAAACLGASFIWGGFQPALRALKEAIHPGGRIAVGEPYWLNSSVPADIKQKEPDFHNELELLQIIRQEGFDLAGEVRASHDDWDRYQSDNWHALLLWLETNPHHPERQQVFDHLRQSQEDYLSYYREYVGWAVYILAPRPEKI